MMDFAFSSPVREETIDFEAETSASGRDDEYGSHLYGTFGLLDAGIVVTPNAAAADKPSPTEISTETMTTATTCTMAQRQEHKHQQTFLPHQHDRPEFVMTIISPDMVTLEPSMVHEEWEPFTAKQDANNIAVHLHLLLVCMLNRLIRGGTLPREAIHLDADATTGTSRVQLLLPRNLMADLLSECERLGIGTVVGMVYASPVETLSMPAPGADPDNNLIVAQPQVVQRGIRRMSMSVRTNSIRSGSMISMASFMSDDLSFATGLIDKQSVDPTVNGSTQNNYNSTASTTNQPTGATVAFNVAKEDSRPGARGGVTDDITWAGDLASRVSDEEKTEANNQNTRNEQDETTSLLPSSSLNQSSVVLGKQTLQDDTPILDDASDYFLEKAKLTQRVADGRREWLATMSWLRVEEIAEQVAAFSSHSVDYILFITCTAIIASFGLITDSSALTLVSNLVSPIMGPVFGFTFGTAIQRRSLIRMSLRNELMSLLHCAMVGSICGAIFSFWPFEHDPEWPSQEILQRAQVSQLSAQAVLALTLGVATALCAPSTSQKGLVGVAVSFILVPPAVTAGTCWAYAMLLYMEMGFGRDENDDTDYWYAAQVSLSMTLMNVVAVWIGGTITFWLKRQYPSNQRDASWWRDVMLQRQSSHQNKIDGRKIHKGAAIQTINLGVRAALDLSRNGASPKYVQELRLSSSRAWRNKQLKAQMNALVQVRDVLFDDALLVADYQEDERLQRAPHLTIDQEAFVKSMIGLPL